MRRNVNILFKMRFALQEVHLFMSTLMAMFIVLGIECEAVYFECRFPESTCPFCWHRPNCSSSFSVKRLKPLISKHYSPISRGSFSMHG